MFYVKTQLSSNAAIEVDITAGNVFCRCPFCRREVPVDLIKLARDEDFGLDDCAVLCEECSRSYSENMSVEVSTR